MGINVVTVRWPASRKSITLYELRQLADEATGVRRQWHVYLDSQEAIADARDMPGFFPVHKYSQIGVTPVNELEIGFVDCYRIFGVDAPVQPNDADVPIAPRHLQRWVTT